MLILSFDIIDKEICFELDADCRVSYQTLSRKFNLSVNAIKKRIDKLIESGVIHQFEVVLSRAMSGGAEWVMADIFTDGSEDIEVFINQLGDYPGIDWVAPLVGGGYQIRALAPPVEGLAELGRFIRSLNPVTDVKIHTFMSPRARRGRKASFTQLQLRVLRSLIDNARMPISHIAKQTGLTPKRVRRVLQELYDSDAVHFNTQIDFTAKLENILLINQIQLNEATAQLEDVIAWFQKHYPFKHWSSIQYSDEPTVLSYFIVHRTLDAEQINQAIKKAPFTKTVQTNIAYKIRIFPSLSRIHLEKFLENTGV